MYKKEKRKIKQKQNQTKNQSSWLWLAGSNIGYSLHFSVFIDCRLSVGFFPRAMRLFILLKKGFPGKILRLDDRLFRAILK